VFGYTLPVEDRVKGSDVTWDASATYKLNDQVNLYTRVATGYLGPAIQDRVTFGSFQNSAPKETTISAEGGIKANTADRRFSMALDGYWYRTKNFQLTAVGGATNSARLLSADHVTGYGVEFEAEARPVPQLTLTAGVSYNFTEIRDPNLVVGVCGGGCTVTDPLNAAGNAYINGNPLPQAPRYIANATARYDVPLANGEKVFFYTDWAYRSSINYFLYSAAEFRGRPLTEGGLKLGYEHQGWEAAVYVRNVLNQIRATSAIDFNNLTGMINDPRIVGGEIRFAF
jgi:iron complex outermembrane receptor protein